MEFYSLSFIFFFLPVSAILYRLIPEKIKNLYITAVSFVFYALCQPEYFILFVLTLVAEYVFSFLFQKSEEKAVFHKNLFFIVNFLNASIMIAFSVLNQLEGTKIPLGTMVVCFTSIGYFTDVYKKESCPITDPFEFFVFIGFFGKLYRGPLVRVDDFRKNKLSGKEIIARSGDGIYLFVKGCAKYVLLAEPLSNFYNQIVESNAREMSVLGAWLSVIAVSMVIFYSLSSFCDMARGIGFLFDFKLSKNFYFPFQSISVTDFLDRFNMTVTGFFKHYVYDNLRTKKDSVPQIIVDTYLISMLCGIWFGVRLTHVLWGIYIGTFILIEYFFLGNILEKIPKFFARIYTFCVTILSMTLFSVSSSGLLETLRGMFAVGNVSVATSEVSYILSQNILVLVTGAFFLTSLFNIFINFLKEKQKTLYGLVVILETIFLIILILGFSVTK